MINCFADLSVFFFFRDSHQRSIFFHLVRVLRSKIILFSITHNRLSSMLMINNRPHSASLSTSHRHFIALFINALVQFLNLRKSNQ
jgi:hypothetical protein